jgi:hypothetical protein
MVLNISKFEKDFDELDILRFKVNSNKEFVSIQNFLFQLGYKWLGEPNKLYKKVTTLTYRNIYIKVDKSDKTFIWLYHYGESTYDLSFKNINSYINFKSNFKLWF